MVIAPMGDPSASDLGPWPLQLMDELSHLLKTVEPSSLAIFLLWVGVHFFAEPLRWYCYRAGQQRSGAEPYFQIFMLSAFLSLTVPMKLGLPARVALLRWKANLQLTTITALLALDGILYYGGWALSATLAVAAFSYSGDLEWMSGGIAAFVLLLAAVAALRRRSRAEKRPHPDGPDFTGWRRGWHEIRVVCATLSIRVLLSAGMIVGADVATQVARHDALLGMFGSHLPWLQLFTIVALSFFAGLVSLMPLGLGGYDVTLVYLLVQAGIPSHTGMAIVVTNRLGSIAVSLLLGSWGGWMLGVNPLRSRWLRNGLPKNSCQTSERKGESAGD